MTTVKVKKEELLKKLKENRTEHESDYNEAVTNYKLELVKELTKMLKDAKAEKTVNHHINLTSPVQFLKEYDRAIQMLEASVEKEIELSQSEFTQYWMDEWNWRNTFSTANSAYSASVRSKSGN